MPEMIIVMGVSGSGKTTVAQALAERLGWPCAEADDFHSPADKAKMASGVPLTDDDRWPWLEAIRDWMSGQARRGENGVVTCSALKRSYRDVLRQAQLRVRFLSLTAPPQVLAERIGDRHGHFMPASLLSSQLATLEPLQADEDGVVVDVSGTQQETLDAAVKALGVGGSSS